MKTLYLIYRSESICTWTCGDGCCSEYTEIIKMEDVYGFMDCEEKAKEFCAERKYKYYPMPLIK